MKKFFSGTTIKTAQHQDDQHGVYESNDYTENGNSASRRQQIAFMRQARSPTRMSLSSSTKRMAREHAKKIAMVADSRPNAPQSKQNAHSGQNRSLTKNETSYPLHSTQNDQYIDKYNRNEPSHQSHSNNLKNESRQSVRNSSLDNHLQKNHYITQQTDLQRSFHSGFDASSATSGCSSAYDMEVLNVPCDASSVSSVTGLDSNYPSPSPSKRSSSSKKKSTKNRFVESRHNQMLETKTRVTNHNVKNNTDSTFHPLNMRNHLSFFDTSLDGSEVGSATPSNAQESGAIARRKSRHNARYENAFGSSSTRSFVGGRESSVGSNLFSIISEAESEHSAMNEKTFQRLRPPRTPGLYKSGQNSFDSQSRHHDSLMEQGFSFDAFGLDPNEIDDEVNVALAELAGSHPGMDFFLDLNDPQENSLQQHSSVKSSPSTAPTATMTLSSFGNNSNSQYRPESQVVAVEKEISDSSSLTASSFDPIFHSQRNMFKDPKHGSSFHKAKRVVRPDQYQNDNISVKTPTTPVVMEDEFGNIRSIGKPLDLNFPFLSNNNSPQDVAWSDTFDAYPSTLFENSIERFQTHGPRRASTTVGVASPLRNRFNNSKLPDIKSESESSSQLDISTSLDISNSIDEKFNTTAGSSADMSQINDISFGSNTCVIPDNFVDINDMDALPETMLDGKLLQYKPKTSKINEFPLPPSSPTTPPRLSRTAERAKWMSKNMALDSRNESKIKTPERPENNMSISQKRAEQWASAKTTKFTVSPLLSPRIFEQRKEEGILNSQNRAKAWAREAPNSPTVRSISPILQGKINKANTSKKKSIDERTIIEDVNSQCSATDIGMYVDNDVDSSSVTEFQDTVSDIGVRSSSDWSSLSPHRRSTKQNSGNHNVELAHNWKTHLKGGNASRLPPISNLSNTNNLSQSLLKETAMSGYDIGDMDRFRSTLPLSELKDTPMSDVGVDPERYKSHCPSIPLRKIPPRPPPRVISSAEEKANFLAKIKLKKTVRASSSTPKIPEENETCGENILQNDFEELLYEESSYEKPFDCVTECSNSSKHTEYSNSSKHTEYSNSSKNTNLGTSLDEQERWHCKEYLKKKESHGSNDRGAPEKDVASLIRRRIALNRKNSAKKEAVSKSEGIEGNMLLSPSSAQREDISIMRNRLKKVSKENKEKKIIAQKILAEKNLRTSDRHEPPMMDDSSNCNEQTGVAIDDALYQGLPISSQVVNNHSALTSNGITQPDADEGHTEPALYITNINSHNQDLPISLQVVNNHSVLPSNGITQPDADKGHTEPALYISNINPHNETLLGNCSTEQTCPSSENNKEYENLLRHLSSKQSCSSSENKKNLSTQSPRTESIASVLQNKMIEVGDKTPPKPVKKKIQVSQSSSGSTAPALKDDPEYAKYFKMLKVGLPLESVKHALIRDGLDPSVLDGDHNKPADYQDSASEIALKDDPAYAKYFKMIKIGLPMGAVQNAIERDGLDPKVLDGDHNAPAHANNRENDSSKVINQPKDKYRRTRLHWDTLRKVRSTSIWAMLNKDPDVDQIEIDETEFAELFQSEDDPKLKLGNDNARDSNNRNVVKVIDPKRANNGGIILARFKKSYDEMAIGVDNIDESVMTTEQMQNIIEFIPTPEEKKSLHKYITTSEDNPAEAFGQLCECEKFMVAMMTVKNCKEKIRALLFKLQFKQCIEDLVSEVNLVEYSCDELRESIRLRKLLGIVLNIGNRLNTAGASHKGKAGAFTIESLLKLNHVKAFDKKTTFLHYVVMVVHRHNAYLSCFKEDLPTVFKSDKVFWDQCVSDLGEVETQLENVRKIALNQVNDSDDTNKTQGSLSLEEEVEKLHETEIGLFTLGAIKKVSALRETVEDTKSKFSQLLEYFGEEDNKRMQPHNLFKIIATFSNDFDAATKEILLQNKTKMKNKAKSSTSIKPPDKKESSCTTNSASDVPTRSTKKSTISANRSMMRSSMQPHIRLSNQCKKNSKEKIINTHPENSISMKDCASSLVEDVSTGRNNVVNLDNKATISNQNKINASIINKKELGSSEVNTDPAISISSSPISVSLEKRSIQNEAIISSNIRTNELCSSNQNKNELSTTNRDSRPIKTQSLPTSRDNILLKEVIKDEVKQEYNKQILNTDDKNKKPVYSIRHRARAMRRQISSDISKQGFSPRSSSIGKKPESPSRIRKVDLDSHCSVLESPLNLTEEGNNSKAGITQPAHKLSQKPSSIDGSPSKSNFASSTDQRRPRYMSRKQRIAQRNASS